MSNHSGKWLGKKWQRLTSKTVFAGVIAAALAAPNIVWSTTCDPGRNLDCNRDCDDENDEIVAMCNSVLEAWVGVCRAQTEACCDGNPTSCEDPSCTEQHVRCMDDAAVAFAQCMSEAEQAKNQCYWDCWQEWMGGCCPRNDCES